VTTAETRRSTAVAATLGLIAAALVTAVQPHAGAAGKGDGSGGPAVAHRAGGKIVRSPNVTRRAPDPKLYRIGLSSSEPTIGVTHDGTVVTSAFQSNTRIEVVRSKNQGKKWEVVSPTLPNGRNSQLLSLDPYTYVDLPRDDKDSSRTFTIDLTVACSYLSYTDDGGDSWITNPLVCGRPVNDHQTLFGGPPVHSPTVGYPNILYYCWNDIASSSCQKSLDGGIAWTITGAPAFLGPDAENQRTCGGLHGHGYVGPDGTVYLPRGYCGQPYLSISRDEGATWTNVQIAKNGISTHEAGIVADKAGNVYYTWTGKDRLPYLSVSRNGGKKWSKPMMVGAPQVNEANLPSIAIGAKGKIAIAYMGTTNSPGMPFPNEGGECTALGACPEPDEYKKTTWNGYVTITAKALAGDPLFYSSTVNTPKDPLIRGACGPGRCKAVFDFIDVTIDRNGTTWSAWVDGCITICAASGPSNIGSDGVVGRLVGGPRLR
jgi:hypothetical protein